MTLTHVTCHVQETDTTSLILSSEILQVRGTQKLPKIKKGLWYLSLYNIIMYNHTVIVFQ